MENGRKSPIRLSHPPHPAGTHPTAPEGSVHPLSFQGGVLGIKIGWACDLDKAWDECVPRYSFTRLDSVSEKSSVSPGYNFR